MNEDDRNRRLKRLDRLFVNSPLYFVTANTEGRKSILAQPQIHENFQNFCRVGLNRGVFVGKYVLMPDHFHLFVAFGEEYQSALIQRRESDAPVTAVCDRRSLDQHISPLSEWMKSLKN